jgi:hypothetical protein
MRPGLFSGSVDEKITDANSRTNPQELQLACLHEVLPRRDQAESVAGGEVGEELAHRGKRLQNRRRLPEDGQDLPQVRIARQADLPQGIVEEMVIVPALRPERGP